MGENQIRNTESAITMAGRKRPGVLQTCLIFSITIILFVLIGYRVQDREFYSGILITEFGLIMMPALLFLLISRFDMKEVLRLHGTRPLNFLVTFCLMLFAIPIAGIFNLLNLLLVNSIFGRVIIQQIPAAKDGKELIINILVIAGSAGLCEEFLFRGFVQRGFERFGTARSIFFAALLFSLTHMDFQKILGTFILGLLIGFIVYKTNSLYCGIFAHFTNNALAVLISYAAEKLMSIIQKTGVNAPKDTDLNNLFSTFSELPPQQLVIVIFIYGIILLFIAAIFILLLYVLIRLNSSRQTDERTLMAAKAIPVHTGDKLKGLLWLLPGILLIAGIYFFEVYRFTGSENSLVNFMKSMLGV